MGWKRKSAETYAETLERLGADALPEMLSVIPKRLVALADRTNGNHDEARGPDTS